MDPSALDAWLVARGSSLLEVVGFASGVLYVWLLIRERVLAWPVGLLNAVVYAVVFQRAGLYSDTGLQIVYFAMCAYGWWHWTRGERPDASLPVTTTPRREAALVALATVAAWLLLAGITRRLPGTSLPLADAALVAVSLAAQWLTTRKRLESWLLWIGANIGYVALFTVKSLRLTAVLYAVFLVLAVRGWTAWRRSYAAERATPRGAAP